MTTGTARTRRIIGGRSRAHRGVPGSLRVLLAGLPALGCASLPSLPFLGDRDASPDAARALALGETHVDRLQCQGESQGDCVDWFQVELASRAQLRVDLKTRKPEEGPGAAPALGFVLENADGKALRRRGPGASLRTRRTSDPGLYRVRVEAGGTTGAVPYELTVREHALVLRRWAVLDAEPPADDGTRRVLIAGGSDDGLKVGFLGRLVSGQQTLARVRVVEVYPEGALVETRGRLAGPLSESSEAEIELPPGR